MKCMWCGGGPLQWMNNGLRCSHCGKYQEEPPKKQPKPPKQKPKKQK